MWPMSRDDEPHHATISLVVVAIIVGIIGISNYDVYVTERDQRNL